VPVLECPGVFAMPVPDGWTATGTSDLKYELLREGDSGAVHVSVYKRNGGPLADDEAHGLISRFVSRITAGHAVDVVVVAESDEQHRAVARCQQTDDGGSTFDWLVLLVLWKQHLIMCSCTADPGSPLLDEAETMFASIHRMEP
jgi:hypothetical protein